MPECFFKSLVNCSKIIRTVNNSLLLIFNLQCLARVFCAAMTVARTALALYISRSFSPVKTQLIFNVFWIVANSLWMQNTKSLFFKNFSFFIADY